MRLSILTASILLLCPLISMAAVTKEVTKTATKSPKITSVTKEAPKAATKSTKITNVISSVNKCLIPGYQAEYKSSINEHNLGIITRTAQKKAKSHYEIISKLNIDKFVFHDLIIQKSVGKIRNNDIVVPSTFLLSDSKKKSKIKPLALNRSLDKLTDNKLSTSKDKVINDSLSYLLQLRMSIINGKMIHEFETRTVKNSNDNKIILSSLHKPVNLDIKGSDGKVSKVKAIKVHYKDSNGAKGNLWLEPAKAYAMVKNEITMLNKKNKQKAVFTEVLNNYDADITKYGCLMQGVKKK
jgi:hypothetical protein